MIPKENHPGYKIIYRVSQDTGHPEIWLSPRPSGRIAKKVRVWDFIKGWDLAKFPGVQCRETPCRIIIEISKKYPKSILENPRNSLEIY